MNRKQFAVIAVFTAMETYFFSAISRRPIWWRRLLVPLKKKLTRKENKTFEKESFFKGFFLWL